MRGIWIHDDAADAIALVGVTAIMARAVTAACFAVIGTVTGFTLAWGAASAAAWRGASWPAFQAAEGMAGPAAHPMTGRAARRSRRPAAPPITGKLAAVTNRIVDRGELSMSR